MHRVKTKTPSYVINITVEFEEMMQDVAAGSGIQSRIAYRPGLPKDKQYTDEQLKEYNKFICNIVDVLYDYGFDVFEDQTRQSTESYSYYINFQPKDTDGNLIDARVTIMFRIADHDMHGKTGWTNRKPIKIIKDFVLYDKSYATMESITSEVYSICYDLQDYDFSSVLEE
jgi:hypothetical protein